MHSGASLDTRKLPPKGGILNLLRIRSGTCVKRCNGAGFREFHEHGTGLKFRHIGYG
jgi:hypothetical protein